MTPISVVARICLAFPGLVLGLSSPCAQEAGESTVGSSARPRIRFEYLTPDDGLSQGTVEAFLHDRQGFIRVVSWDGLNRYEGYSFKVFKPNTRDPHSLSGNLVHALYEDSQGILWVCTNNGLNRFDRKTERFERYQHDPENPRSLSHNDVRGILETADTCGSAREAVVSRDSIRARLRFATSTSTTDCKAMTLTKPRSWLPMATSTSAGSTGSTGSMRSTPGDQGFGVRSADCPYRFPCVQQSGRHWRCGFALADGDQ